MSPDDERLPNSVSAHSGKMKSRRTSPRRLVASTGLIGLSNFVNVGAAAVLIGLSLDYAGLNAVGQWSVLLAFAALFGVIDLGLSGTVSRFTADYHSQGEHQRIWQVWTLSLGGVAAVASAALCTVLWIPQVLLGAIHTDSVGFLYWLPLVVASQMITDQVRSAMLGLRRTFTVGLLDIIGSACAFLVSMFFLMSGVGITSLGIGLLARAVVISIPGICVVGIEMRRVPYRFPDLRSAKVLFTYSLPLFAAATVGVLFLNAGRICLSLIAGADAVGIFETANRIALVLTAATSPILVVALPYITTLRRDPPSIRRGVKTLEEGLAVVLGIVSGGLVIAGGFALSIWLKESQMIALISLLLLIVGYTFVASTGPSTVALRARGRQWIEAVSLVVGVVVLLIVVLILSARLGAAGAGAGIAAGGLIYLCVLTILMLRQNEGEFRPNMKSVALSVSLFLVGFAVWLGGRLIAGSSLPPLPQGFILALAEMLLFLLIAAALVYAIPWMRSPTMAIVQLLRKRSSGLPSETKADF